MSLFQCHTSISVHQHRTLYGGIPSIPALSLYKYDMQQDHIQSCKFTRIPCPNEIYDCSKMLLQNQWEHLASECRFTPVQCPWCSKMVHNKKVSEFFAIYDVRV